MSRESTAQQENAVHISIIDHPVDFTTGTRVLVLRGRRKDGIENQRSVLSVSHSSAQFGSELFKLAAIAGPDERIYASAGERSMLAAVREFKRRQLDADYDPDPQAFYRSIDARWTSCLMHPASQAEKLWLVDCDSAEDTEMAAEDLMLHYKRPMPPYRYATKSGTHFIVQAFDRTALREAVRELIHENPLMLWGY